MSNDRDKRPDPAETLRVADTPSFPFDRELIETRAALEERTVELAEALALARATLDATSDGIVVAGTDGRIRFVNRSTVESLRIPAESLVGMPHRDVAVAPSVPVVERDAHRAALDAIYAAPTLPSSDLFELADGRVFQRTSTPYVVESRVIGRIWCYRDLTEQRRAQEAEDDERQVLDLGRKIASTLDLEGLVQLATDTCTELVGAQFGAFFYNVTDEKGDAYQLFTLSGAPRAAFEKFGHPRATALFGPTFEGKPSIRLDDVTKDARYGSMGPHHGMPPGHLPVRSYLAVPVVARDGAVFGGLFFGHSEAGVFTERGERVVSGIASQVAIAMDNAKLYEATKRLGEERLVSLASERAARAEVERVSLLKDEFLATVSHELRTPLNAVLGWAELLLGMSHADPQVHKGLETIARNARAQAKLIEDLLDMNRIMSGKVRMDVQPTDLAALTAGAVESVRLAAEAKNITIRTVLDSGSGTVAGDPHRLQQIVWNLLSNAVKFTPKGGRISVVLARVGSQLELTVKDTGAGIEPAFLPHVFERFRQADASTTRRTGGLGLGLAIVKQLAEMHGGSVRAESNGPGTGSTFVVTVPVSVVRRTPREVTRPESHTPQPIAAVSLRGVRLVVVDDEPDARELLEQLLGALGAQVQSAPTATAALELVRTEHPDVLVSDIGMPEMDGYQLIRAVRDLPAGEGGRTPAIALTAFARVEDRTRSMRAGFQLHLSKPVEAQELVAAISSLTGRVQPGR